MRVDSMMERVANMSPAVLYCCRWQADTEQFVASYVSEAITPRLGYERQACLQPGWWRAHIHPDDRRKVDMYAEKLLELGEITYEYRFANAEGEYRWIRDHVQLYRGDNDSPAEIVGSWLDISELRSVQSQQLESDEMYRSLVEQSFDGIIAVDVSGMVVFANTTLARDWGGPVDDIIGHPILDFVHPDEKQRLLLHFHKRFKGAGPAAAYETRLIRNNGQTAWVDIVARLITYRGEPANLCFIRDISERKAREQTLLQMQTIIDQAKDCIYATDLDGRYILLNQASERLLKRSRAELIGHSYIPFIAPEYLPAVQRMLQRKLAGEISASTYEVGIVDADGAHHAMENNSTLVRDEQGQIIAVQGVLRDISERKRMQALECVRSSLLEMAMRPDADIDYLLQELVSSIELQCPGLKGSVLLLDEKGKYLFTAAAPSLPADFSAAIDGVAVGPAVGSCGTAAYKEQRVIVSDIATDPLWQNFKSIALTHGLRACWSEPIKAADGKLLGTFALYYHAVREPDGFECHAIEVAASLAAMILVHQRATAALRFREKQYRELIESTDALPWTYHFASDRFTYVGPQVRNMLGIEPDALSDFASWIALIHPDDRECAVNYCQERTSAGEAHELEYRMKAADGSWRWIRDVVGVQMGSDGPVSISGYMFDITARKLDEAQLILLRSAVSAVNEGIIITNPDGVTVYVNPSFEKITGYSAAEAIGRRPSILNSKQQPRSFYEHFWKTIKAGQPWAGRIMDRRKDGTIFPVHLSVAPIFDQQGKISHYVAIHEDLTENELLQRKMMQSQKMEAVGTVAGGIAHDFNNMLAGLLGNVYLLRMHHADNKEIVERTRTMEVAMQHGAKLIAQLLTFARKDRPDMCTMDLRAFIKEGYKMSQAALPENISFAMQCLPDTETWIDGDATQLQQVLLNLVTNAKFAVAGVDSPEIIVALERRDPPVALLQLHPEMHSEFGWSRLSCSDNGCGIDAANMEHIFDPFFTTREVGEGTGLGLAMVLGAVQNHHGLIDIHSIPDEGTTISLYLPLQQAGAMPHSGVEDVLVDAGGKVILLVDDEQLLRTVLAEVLESNGFCVLQACDGEQALQLFRKHSQRIDLVLMDVVMPNMGGVAAAKAIRGMDARVPIVFQTGYGEQTQLDAAASILYSDALQKPVCIPDMIRMMMEKLHQ